jgi:hypothetical protein
MQATGTMAAGRRPARRWAAAAAAAGAVLATVGVVTPASAQAPEPYADPPWADDCVVHRFGEGESPDPGALDDDPLCVRYAKEDITVDDGGALDFLAAEPERVMAAVPACRYWQRDRWSVQLSAGTPALVSWEGSYWWDRAEGRAAAILRDFQIGGQPAGAHQVADLLEPLSAEWAETLREYSGGPGGGAGGMMDLGGSDPSCAEAQAEPDPDPGYDPDDELPSDSDAPAPAAAPASARELPATGGAAAPIWLLGAVAAAALVARRLARLP